jgi:hypothetical protein
MPGPRDLLVLGKDLRSDAIQILLSVRRDDAAAVGVHFNDLDLLESLHDLSQSKLPCVQLSLRRPCADEDGYRG